VSLPGIYKHNDGVFTALHAFVCLSEKPSAYR